MSKGEIHVLHIVPMLIVGGMELSLLRLTAGLHNGFRHSICCISGEPTLAHRFDKLATVVAMRSGSNELGLPMRLAEFIRKIRPDVIHARNWGAWPDVAIGRLFCRPRPPLVFSFHGLKTAELPPLRRRLTLRVLAKMTTSIFTVSLASADLLASFGLPRQRIEVIPNGVETDRFTPPSRRQVIKPAGRIVIGAVGNLSPVKNHALLLEACARLRRLGLEVTIRIAGEGACRVPLAEQARRLGIDEHVELVGHVGEVPAFLRELDVFVLCSDSEAHPNSLLEAMSCGLPCVATAVGGCGEVLGDGAYGMLIQRSDASALSESLARLIGDPQRSEELGRLARRRVIEAYSLDRMINSYRELYESLVR